MTEEEKKLAREYAKKFGDDNILHFGKFLIDLSPIRKESFIAGLEAGKPKWHDLRKNPNDLPKEDCEVFAITETDGSLYKGLEDYYLDKTDTFDGWGTCQKVIAWCEIPQYEEE